METSCLDQKLNQTFETLKSIDSHQSESRQPFSEIENKLSEATEILSHLRQNDSENKLEILEECLENANDVMAENKKLQKRVEELQNFSKNSENERNELMKKCDILQSQNRETNMILRRNQTMFDENVRQIAYLSEKLAPMQRYCVDLEEKLKNAMEHNNNQLESYKLQTNILNQELNRMQEEAKIQKKICIETYAKQQNTEQELEYSTNKIKVLQNQIMELNFVIDCLSRDNKNQQKDKEENEIEDIDPEKVIEEKPIVEKNIKLAEQNVNKLEDLSITDNLKRMEKDVSIKGNKIEYLTKQIRKLHQELTSRGKNKTKH